jgi:hypothetical protein
MNLRGLFEPRDSDLLFGFLKPPETAVSSNRGSERFSKKNQLLLLWWYIISDIYSVTVDF